MSTVAELRWTQFWQTSVVALAAGVIAWAFCRRKPHLAYLVWMVVIAKCLTPPLWSSPTGAFSWAMKTRSATEPTRSPANNTALGARPVGPIAASAPAPITQHVALSDQINTDRTFAWPTATTTLGIIWLAGALAFATFMAWNLKRASRRLKRTALPLDPTLLDQSNDCARRLALRKRVRFVVTSAPVGPAAYGILRPVVVLPHSIVKQMPPSALAPIIAHELVHIRRGDSLVALIQVFAQ